MESTKVFENNLTLSRFLFSFSGLHPEKIGSKFQHFLFLLTVIGNMFALYMAFLLIIYSENLILTDLVGYMESILLISHGTLKLVNVYIQRRKLEKLLKQFVDFWTIEQIDDSATRASCFKTVKALKIVTYLYCFCCSSAVYSVIIQPLMNKDLVFASYIPKEIPYNYLFAIQIYVYVTGIFAPVIGMDFLYMTVVLMMKLQFQILNYNAKNLFPMGVVLDDTALRLRIKRWVDYHNYLLDFVQLFNEIFSLTLFLYFGIIILSTCMELFALSIQLTSGDTMKYYTYILYLLFFEFIAFYCLPAQIVTDEAEKLNYNIWANNWQEVDSALVKNAMTMMVMRIQPPVLIQAGIVDASFQTCLATLKTIGSYYMFLKTMDDKDV